MLVSTPKYIAAMIAHITRSLALNSHDVQGGVTPIDMAVTRVKMLYRLDQVQE